jgi:hypothetical protein
MMNMIGKENWVMTKLDQVLLTTDSSKFSKEFQEFVIVLDDGSKIVIRPRKDGPLLSFTNRLIVEYRLTQGERCEVWGLLIGDDQAGFHMIYRSHIVRISPYFESASDIEPVGRATVEEPSSERPPFEVSGY